MILPEYVLSCIRALEAAGFAAYAVGGCVRDACLGITPHDYDLCTSALPEETETVFSAYSLVLAGKKHGTVGVVTEGGVVEITTFRTEGGYQDSRHPDWVKFVPSVEEDLSRRDFTINAMAYSPSRGFADPFGGRQDLEQGILRCVGDPETRFREDALRILRGARFAARFGLSVEAKTMEAMVACRGLMGSLARERVFSELCGLLPRLTVRDMKAFAPLLCAVIPELEPTLDFDQRNPHHAYDLYTHIAHVVEAVPDTLPLRWAALLHDIGKISCFTMDDNGQGHFLGHASVSAEMADGILHRLKAPTALREQVVTLIRQHMTLLSPEKTFLRRRLSRLGWDTLQDLLTLQEADTGSKGTGTPSEIPFSLIRRMLFEIQGEECCLTIKDLAVNGHDLMALGYQGKAIGTCLQYLLDQIMEEALSNDREVILNHLKTKK